MELKVGQHLLEINRFTKDYTIYRIDEILECKTYMYMTAVYNNQGKTIGKQQIGADIDAHCYTKSTWLTYLLPTYDLIYAPE